MRAYCPVSLALKLAGACLAAGLVAGVWASNTLFDAPDSRPSDTPPAQVADVLPVRP